MFSFKNGIIKTPFFDIETRPFYIVQFEDGTWSDYWLHGNPECGCGEYEEAMEYPNRKKVSIFQRITIHQNWSSHLFLFIFGFILGLLI